MESKAKIITWDCRTRKQSFTSKEKELANSYLPLTPIAKSLKFPSGPAASLAHLSDTHLGGHRPI